MGILKQLVEGGPFLDVLGGMAIQYNQRSADARAMAFEEKQLDKKIEAENERFKQRLAQESNFDIEQYKAKKVAELTAKAQVEKEFGTKKPDPLAFELDLRNVTGILDDDLRDKHFKVTMPKFDTKATPRDRANTYLNNYINAGFTGPILDKLRKEPVFRSNYDFKSKLSTLEDNLTRYYTQLMVQEPTYVGGEKVGVQTIPTESVVKRMEDNHPVLTDRYFKSIGSSLADMKKKLNIVGVDVAAKMTPNKNIAVQTYDNNESSWAYYRNSGGNRPNQNYIAAEDAILNNYNANEVKGLSLVEKKKYYDTLAKTIDPERLSYAGSGALIVNAGKDLRKDLAQYTVPLKGPTISQRARINNFFLSHPNKDDFKRNPELAVEVIKFALPEQIKQNPALTMSTPPSIVGGRLFELTPQGQTLLAQQKKDLLSNNLKEVGFPKPEVVEYKKQSLQTLVRYSKAFEDLVKIGADGKPAIVGAAGNIQAMFVGAMSQFSQFGDVARNLFGRAEGYIDDDGKEVLRTGYDELVAMQSNILETAKKLQDPKLDANLRATALIDYYAEVITFTMAATIQSGSDGSVDTRTISDADVRRFSRAIKAKILAQIQGRTDVVSEIMLDAKRKLFILNGLSSTDVREQSATKLLNDSFFQEISMMDARYLKDNYNQGGQPEKEKEIDFKDINNKSGLVFQ
jgi:hypothetical protein